MKLSVRSEVWPTPEPFRITGHTAVAFEPVVVQLARAGHVGQGEALGVYYLGDTAASVLAEVESARAAIEAGVDRTSLMQLLPAGGARNAIDCALWDLEAKSRKTDIWTLAGLSPRALETQYTIGIMATPEATAERALAVSQQRLLKLKVDDDLPLERVRAVRLARPDARIVVDANQAWSLDLLKELAPKLVELDIHMIEQPLRRGEDAGLDRYRSPVPLCADESCLHLGELDQAAKRYQLINIKLDKVGGLTAGLELAHAAHARGLGVMVGCMGGTSLSMAPAFVLASICEIADLDGPLWLRSDRLPGIAYDGGRMSLFGPEVWG